MTKEAVEKGILHAMTNTGMEPDDVQKKKLNYSLP
jgi:hypothetical protein